MKLLMPCLVMEDSVSPLGSFEFSGKYLREIELVGAVVGACGRFCSRRVSGRSPNLVLDWG